MKSGSASIAAGCQRDSKKNVTELFMSDLVDKSVNHGTLYDVSLKLMCRRTASSTAAPLTRLRAFIQPMVHPFDIVALREVGVPRTIVINVLRSRRYQAYGALFKLTRVRVSQRLY